MKASRSTNAQLLEWAAMIILREQSADMYGTIHIHMEKGTITRAVVERVEKPADMPPTVA